MKKGRGTRPAGVKYDSKNALRTVVMSFLHVKHRKSNVFIIIVSIFKLMNNTDKTVFFF